MKKNGMTIIESVVAIALLGIIFLLVAPLINSFGKVKNRVKTQKQIDAEFSVVNEFIQEKIRAAKRTDKETPFSGADKDEFHTNLKYVSVYNDFHNTANTLFAVSNRAAEGELGNVLVLEIPFEEGEDAADDRDGDGERLESQFEILAFIDGALKYKVIDYADNSFKNFETLIENVEVYSDPDNEDPLEKSSFKLDKGILVYYINLNIDDSEGKFRDSLRGSASTRIDINY